MYKWSEFLDRFFNIIPRFFFIFLRERQSFLQKTSASLKEEVLTLRGPECNIPLGELPQEIPLKGLTNDREWYLFEQIREFCSTNEAADLTCPKPSHPKSNQQNLAVDQSQPSNPSTGKHQRLCSVCRLPGHNKCSCTKRGKN